MENVLIDIRKLDLADRIGKDMISVKALLEELENALEEIDMLEEKLEESGEEPDPYDEWHDRKMMEEI